jgi:2-aminoadipate transaminase
METPWDHRYAQRTQRMTSSAIRELLKLTEDPEVISFAGGLPAPDVFPVDEFNAACAQVLKDWGAQALQYGSTEGYLPLREMIARHTGRYQHNGTEYSHHQWKPAGTGFIRKSIYQSW